MASPFAPGTDLPITSTTNPHALHFPAKDELAHTKSMNEVIHNAKSATDKEHKMTLWQGIKLYPKAVGWSLLISTCIAMEGYDVCLLSNFCEYPYLVRFLGGEEKLVVVMGRKLEVGEELVKRRLICDIYRCLPSIQ
jgi:hypothetical protein